MLDALVKYAQDEDFSKLLPQTGFYNYSEPIRWTVQIFENTARLEESNLEGIQWSRPFTGRTGNIEPHSLADEASYALGIAVDSKGKTDERAGKKNLAFLSLLNTMLSAEEVGVDLRDAILRVIQAIEQKWIATDPRFGEILAKDWIAFQVESGPLSGKRLFNLPEAHMFWDAEIRRRITKTDPKQLPIMSECSICGQERPMISRVPISLKPIGRTGPVHSINSTAFASGRLDDKGHIGMCYECSDSATRGFNTLASGSTNRRVVVKDKVKKKWKVDSLKNQVALFWLDRPITTLGAEDFDFLGAFGDLMKPAAQDESEDAEESGEATPTKTKRGKAAKGQPSLPKPTAKISQLGKLLNVQAQATGYMTNLDEGRFSLAIFSPNVGRTALREWMHLSLGTMLPNVRAYLNATTVNDAWGKEARPQPINALMDALDSKNVNLTRDLIRTTYQGTPPPVELLVLAVQRFRTLTVKGKQDKQLAEWERQRHLYSLVAVLKLSLFYGPVKAGEGEMFMTGLNKLYTDPAYLCGRLLAVLEEAQQVYSYHQGGKRLKTSMAQRSFGTASTAPQGVMPRLVKLATVAHLPRAGKSLNIQMEELVQQIVEKGGYPQSLDMQGQGNFGLGYWQQRGEIRAHWSEADKQADDQAEATDEGANL